MSRQTLLAVAAIFLTTAALPARAQQAEPRILVTGTVVDSVSGYPVYGVAVATSTTTDRTASDSTGAFTLSVPAGTTMVTFTGRGFQRVGQLVASTANVELGRVALLPDAVALEPIEASVSLLEERVRSYTGSAFVFGASILQHSGDRDLFDFLQHRTGARPIGCNTLDPNSGGDCWRVRGIPTRPRLFINEVQVASTEILRVYRPEDVARVEVFGGGMMIRVYTRSYLEMMSRSNRAPDPLLPG
jgi:Carboxypeptidase regulatory-like domain